MAVGLNKELCEILDKIDHQETKEDADRQRLPARAAALVRKEPMLLLSAAAAVASLFITPPSARLLSDIDWHTLATLFMMLTVLEGFKSENIFRPLLRLAGGIRSMAALSLFLVFSVFFSSMFVPNDVSLIIFVPLTIMLFRAGGRERYILPVITMENIAAVRGSLLTPFGSPQNLFIYGQSGVPALRFMRYMLPLWLMSAALLVGFVLALYRGNLGMRSGVRDMSFAGEWAAEGRLRRAAYLSIFAVVLWTIVSRTSLWGFVAVGVAVAVRHAQRGANRVWVAAEVVDAVAYHLLYEPLVREAEAWMAVLVDARAVGLQREPVGMLGEVLLVVVVEVVPAVIRVLESGLGVLRLEQHPVAEAVPRVEAAVALAVRERLGVALNELSLVEPQHLERLRAPFPRRRCPDAPDVLELRRLVERYLRQRNPLALRYHLARLPRSSHIPMNFFISSLSSPMSSSMPGMRYAWIVFQCLPSLYGGISGRLGRSSYAFMPIV